jgi:Zn-finger protein
MGRLAEVMEMSQITLTEEHEKEGYHVEDCEDRVLVWHKKNQTALLYRSPDIDRKVQEVVEKRRKELKEVEEKTGWKAD